MTSADENDIPRAGDLAWVNLDPRVGHERSGNRPALIISPYGYHEKTPYMIICPITSNMKPYPFKVILPEGLAVQGAVLVDQVKSVDRWAQGCDVAGRAPETVMADVRGLLAALFGINVP
jgi:mRNA interferase MazF